MKRITDQQFRTLRELCWGDRWVPGNKLYANTATLRIMVKRKLLRKRKGRPLITGGKPRVHYQITAKGMKAYNALDNPRRVIRLLDEIEDILADGG